MVQSLCPPLSLSKDLYKSINFYCTEKTKKEIKNSVSTKIIFIVGEMQSPPKPPTQLYVRSLTEKN
jgi:hypothetical protein